MKNILQTRPTRWLLLFAKGSFDQFVRCIAYVAPPHRWYGIAVRFSRQQAKIVGKIMPLFSERIFGRTIVGHMMDHWFSVFTKTGRPFPIPIDNNGTDILTNAFNHKGGLIVCSVHLPLFRLIPRSLVEINHPPDLLIALHPENEGRYSIWGLTGGLPAAPPTLNILAKVRTILRNGGLIAVLVDNWLGGPYSTNIFQFARRAKARIIFALPDLRPDGRIQMEWIEPPDPFCLTDAGIERNIQLLDARVRAICSATNWKDIQIQPNPREKQPQSTQMEQLPMKRIS